MGYKQNLHTHSTYCDGNDTPEQMVLAAVEQGFDSIGFSSHSYVEEMKDFSIAPDMVCQYKSEISQLREKYRDKIRIFCGLEKDCDTQMDTTGFDYLIGSVHCMKVDGQMLHIDWDAQKLRHNVEDVYRGDGIAYARRYFAEVGKIADACPVDIIGHFDLLTKFSERVSYFDTDAMEYVQAAIEAMDALAGKVPFFEINTGAIARGYRTAPYPAENLIREFKKRGFGAVITTDCHNKKDLSCGYDAAKACLIRNGFTHHYVLKDDGFVSASLFD